jgi:histidinol-phosphate aminotransferase
MKNKNWITNIERKENLIDKSKFDLCLDQSEKIDYFPHDFFKEFISFIKQEDIIRYPNFVELKEKIALFNNVEFENIFLTPGSDQCIKTAFEICVEPHANVISSYPCFPMYEIYSNQCNAIFYHDINYDKSLYLDLNKILNRINSKTRLIILSNPNSPIGDYKTYHELLPLIKETNKLGIIFLIDEAYVEFSPGSMLNAIEFDNVLISRTFSKAFGGAGLRVGYIIGNKKLINLCNKFRMMYEITSLSSKFCIHLLNNYYIIEKYIEETKLEKDLIKKNLLFSNYDVIDSSANWLHFNDKNNNEGIERIFLKNNVAIKNNVKIPFDDRNNWTRLTIGPKLNGHNVMKEIYKNGL